MVNSFSQCKGRHWLENLFLLALFFAALLNSDVTSSLKFFALLFLSAVLILV